LDPETLEVRRDKLTIIRDEAPLHRILPSLHSKTTWEMDSGRTISGETIEIAKMEINKTNSTKHKDNKDSKHSINRTIQPMVNNMVSHMASHTVNSTRIIHKATHRVRNQNKVQTLGPFNNNNNSNNNKVTARLRVRCKTMDGNHDRTNPLHRMAEELATKKAMYTINRIKHRDRHRAKTNNLDPMDRAQCPDLEGITMGIPTIQEINDLGTIPMMAIVVEMERITMEIVALNEVLIMCKTKIGLGIGTKTLRN